VKTSGYPTLIWGNEIDVVKKGTSLAVTAGQATYKRPRRPQRDPVGMAKMAAAAESIHQLGVDAPHARFANASSEAELIQFVRDFGPIHANSVKEDLVRARGRLVAIQNMELLRAEQMVFRQCVDILAEIKKGPDADTSAAFQAVVEICFRVAKWPRQWRAEKKAREDEQTVPIWRFTQRDFENVEAWKAFSGPEPEWIGSQYDELDAANSVLCLILNAFIPHVQHWDDITVEGPHWDIRYGVRPCLYYALRNAYLGRSPLEKCQNSECQKVFVPDRAGQQFCSDVCSRLQRQRDYWKTRGSKRRQERRGEASR